MDLQLRLLNRSVSGSILAAVCKSVILDHLVALRAVLIAEFCTLWRHGRFVLDALQIATLPNSSTGLIYCLYSFNSVTDQYSSLVVSQSAMHPRQIFRA